MLSECPRLAQLNHRSEHFLLSYSSIESVADVDEHNSRRSFFDGMSEVHSRKSLRHTRSKRTLPVADPSPKPTPSRSASIRDHLTPSPKVEPLQNEKPYHYQKRSAISFHNGAIGEPSPDEQTLEVTKRRAGALEIAIRAIESASYLPTSIGGTSTPDGSSGSLCLPTFDDLDSVSSESIYSPIEYMDDKVEQRAPEDVFKQRLLKRSVSFNNIELPTPLTPLRSQMVSFSRPTPQVYPYLICQASARQDSSQQVTHQSPINHIRISVPLKTSPAPRFAPLSPPALPNRNPKRTPSDSGHGPLIHATLDRPFLKEGQVKSGMFTPGPRTIVLNRPAPSPSSERREPLSSFGKRF